MDQKTYKMEYIDISQQRLWHQDYNIQDDLVIVLENIDIDGYNIISVVLSSEHVDPHFPQLFGSAYIFVHKAFGSSLFGQNIVFPGHVHSPFTQVDPPLH